MILVHKLVWTNYNQIKFGALNFNKHNLKFKFDILHMTSCFATIVTSDSCTFPTRGTLREVEGRLEREEEVKGKVRIVYMRLKRILSSCRGISTSNLKILKSLIYWYLDFHSVFISTYTVERDLCTLDSFPLSSTIVMWLQKQP